ncbi:MAG: TonB-dependent receptor [Burkholderiales bacterium RIFCSPLOWO2_02_FULL_57_36]|nr:MAG: TonB-dependent receptor [Burkholderiales bacterium RIFCSPLOWO2_02_FULL_57_36]
MHVPRILSAAAISAAFVSLYTPVFAQIAEKSLPPVIVTATPFNAPENAQILTPATVLSGDELRNKLEPSLGNTLSRELGVSSSAFGAGASRPIIRGLEGPRVKILQNGMSVLDVSSLSNDHAVGVETSTARQIEILRGPAALLYGSGAIGGLVNVVNDRIPTELMAKPTGEAEVRFGSANREKNLLFSADGSSGPVGLHLDANLRDADDYKIPGFSVLNDPASAQGRLPSSFSRANSLGLGASHIADWGHIGASVGAKNDRYGIPTAEQSFITLSQTRFDMDSLIRQPLAGFESFKFKLGHTDYKHTENLQDGTPATNFKNRAIETRWELAHKPLAGWRGTLGMQTENSKYSALAADGSGPETVPITKSSSVAGFLVEERDFGPIRASAGARLESVKRRPDTSAGLPDRDFKLGSYSIGGLWAFVPGYSFGPTLSIAQRAPAIEELYSNGPHEATRTFDIGDAGLHKETSRNIELTLQKTEGLVRWKANLFENKIKNFVYGRTDGTLVDDDGAPDPAGEFRQRFWSQANATIRGAEMEVSYNLRGEGLSLRGFTDTSRGTLDGAGSLPLQPASRVGIDADFKQGPWRTGIGLLRAKNQDRLAAFETTRTSGYTQLDAHLSYTQRVGTTQLTGFVLAKNLLNQDIRLSTSVLKDVAPLPGRSLIVGVRTRF